MLRESRSGFENCSAKMNDFIHFVRFDCFICHVTVRTLNRYGILYNSEGTSMANILIIDDSRTSRKVLKNLLEADGHKIIAEAVNGEEGVSKFIEYTPDIVTMDITMPVMDGIEALKKIREINENAKVVMVTAAGQANKIREAVSFGASEFLAKPFEPEQITEIIKRVAATL